MPNQLYYKATHSSGRIHLRSSRGRVYTYAVVGPNAGAQSFAARLDLAEKELAKQMKYRHDRPEIVPAVAITREEYAELVRNGKQHFRFGVEGKVVRRTVDKNSPPLVGMYVEVYERHVERHQIAADAPEATKARYPDGFYETASRARINVRAFDKNQAAKYEAKAAGTYVKSDKWDAYDAIGERGLIKRYIARPL